jgi:hypothetical protein
MCANCVASASPMIVAGLTVMRRDALKAWITSLRPDQDDQAARQPAEASS